MLDGLGPIESTDAAARAVMRLRAEGHSPEFVSAVVGQARLRTKATAKFGEFSGRMLFTRAGLEQATRLGVAARHAGRLRAAGITHVSDLGSGIGGDALAFAGAGIRVTAVDADEVTAALAAFNLAPFGPRRRCGTAWREDVRPPLRPAEREADRGRVAGSCPAHRGAHRDPPCLRGRLLPLARLGLRSRGADPDRHQARPRARPRCDPRRRRGAVGSARTATSSSSCCGRGPGPRGRAAGGAW